MRLTPSQKGSLGVAATAVSLLLIRWYIHADASLGRPATYALAGLVLMLWGATAVLAVSALREARRTWSAWVGLLGVLLLLAESGASFARVRRRPTPFQPFVSVTGGFTADFPTTPLEEQHIVTTEGGVPTSVRMWASAESMTDGINVLVFDDASDTSEPLAARLDSHEARFLALSKGALLARRDVAAGPTKGREIEVSVPARPEATPPAPESFVRIRWYLDGPRGFQLARSLASRHADPGGDRFFGSFKVLPPTP